MNPTSPLSIKSWAMMLCILLALVFAGASLSNAIDAIHHAGSVSHDHSVLSEASILSDHAVEHLPSSDDGDPSDHLPGSHHHHGESNPGLPASLAATDSRLALAIDPDSVSPAALHLGLRVAGPERPPKS